jgi:hypothetical protein
MGGKMSKTNPTGGGRLGAMEVLEDKIKRMERRVTAVKIILYNLDWDNLTPEEEEILWSFFCSASTWE